MQVSPESAKRSPAKSKSAVAAAPSAARKSRKKTAEPAVATPAETPDLTPVIAVTAYYIAAQRNFAPGRELDDWLEAERRVRGTSG